VELTLDTFLTDADGHGHYREVNIRRATPCFDDAPARDFVCSLSFRHRGDSITTKASGETSELAVLAALQKYSAIVAPAPANDNANEGPVLTLGKESKT
jgi:hypothetical protein